MDIVWTAGLKESGVFLGGEGPQVELEPLAMQGHLYLWHLFIQLRYAIRPGNWRPASATLHHHRSDVVTWPRLGPRWLARLPLAGLLFRIRRRVLSSLARHQRPVTFHLTVPHDEKRDDDTQPVQVIREDGAIRGRVCPAEDGVEEAPAATAVVVGAAALPSVSVTVRL